MLVPIPGKYKVKNTTDRRNMRDMVLSHQGMEPGLQGMEPDHHQVMELGHHQVMEPGHHQGMEPGPQGMGGRTKNQPNVMESGTGREMVTGEEVMVGDVVGEREIACKDGNKIKRLSS